MRALLRTFLLLSSLTACQTYLEPEESVPTATGSWRGMGAAGFTIFELDLSLTEGDFGRITGSGRLTSPGRPTFNFVVRKVGDEATTSSLADAFVDEISRLTVEDKHIWEHKAYVPRPALADHDGPIMKFRRWASQFYAEGIEEGDRWEPAAPHQRQPV